MSATQQHRFLAIETALATDTLLIEDCSISEALSRPFEMQAELASEDIAIKFDDVVGTNATIRLELANGKTRYFNGYISRFVQTEHKASYARYRATLVPWLWFLTRAADCRIFQHKKVPDIVEEVFKAHGFSDYKLSLTDTYRQWEYCVQYRETDFNFISRLLEQEGIYYFFSHENGKHTLVLADSASAHSPFGGYGEMVYRPRSHKGEETAETVTDWVIEQEVQPGAYALSDFNFTAPMAPVSASSSIGRQHAVADFEIFDYPGQFETPSEADQYAKVRIQEVQVQHEVLRAQATARGVSAGSKFKLTGHPRREQEREYLITSSSCRVSAGEFQSVSSGGGGGEFFTCSFTALPLTEQYRPARVTPKPLVHGPQTAIVVGTKGEEVDTDEYGRVKVQFHWDRYGKYDENSSCWVRVSQNCAGKGWGAMTLPRIGQEVIVDFLEGDPDRPIITGRVYNAMAKVPYGLPAHKTISTVKSNSSKGGQGFNEIRFEDKKGGEQIFVHGEKDQDIRVKNDAKEWIGNDRHLVVKKDQKEMVEGDKHSTVKGDSLSMTGGDHAETVKGGRFVQISGAENLTVAGDQSTKIDGDVNLEGGKNLNQKAGQKLSIQSGQDFHEKAGQNYAMEAGQNIHLKGGMNVVIEAGMQLSLKVGGNFIDIGPAGVAIKGTMVMINSGGAAGSGGGSSPTAPNAPEPPDPPSEPLEAADAEPGEIDALPQAPAPPTPSTFSPAAKVLQGAAANGSPFCDT